MVTSDLDVHEHAEDLPVLLHPRFRCHKVVWANKIAKIRRDDWGGAVLEFFDKVETKKSASGGIVLKPIGRYAHAEVSSAYVQEHAPEVGGYWVRYADGYESFSPADAFLVGYTLVEGEEGQSVDVTGE